LSGTPLRSVRRTLRYPAKIDRGNGSPPRECTILNISDMEARIIVGNASLPEEFTLLLGGGGKRRCRLRSRSAGEIEVWFMSEPRQHPRNPCDYSAIMEFGDGSPSQECGLIDISTGGARLTVRGAQPVANTFVLCFLQGVRRQCAVRWRSGHEMGVQFV
jgi:PilZ domain